MQQTPSNQETSRRDFFKKAGERAAWGGSDVRGFIDGNSSTEESHSGFRQLRES
jgi:hypothetical protein